jgi:hypothetical protein
MSLDLLLTLPEADSQQIWRQTQSFAIPHDRWNAYLNQLCVTALLPWLREESPQTKIATNTTARSSIWSLVNGTAFTLDGLRLVVMPTEAIDHDELRIPQEWVDLPSWAADYYLAVQVEPDEGWVKVWGYTTHHTLKTRGHYDADDRTYSLSEDDLISDLNILWLSRELNLPEPTRADVAPLPALSLEQANNLLDRLANPAIEPRLAVPFHLWGALLEHGGWRQQLSQRRQGLPAQTSVLQWLQTGVSALAQQLGWEQIELQPALSGARGSETSAPIPVLSRRLAIAGQTYDLQVIPQAESSWRFELRNTAPGGLVPGGFKLRLLTEDLQAFEGNEAIAQTAVEVLFIEVALESGEGLVWETEPISEEFDREILCF